jgi:hypothetical protein
MSMTSISGECYWELAGYKMAFRTGAAEVAA